MDEDGIGIIFGVFAIIVVVYIILLVAYLLSVVGGVAGLLWGGGTAIVNYGKSFQENMIDSNAVTA